MHSLKATYSRNLYLPWLHTLNNYGDHVEVRGHKTIEFLNCITEISEPWHHCILIPSRRWNPFLALSEALWILAGRDDVGALSPYNSHISDYSDDGVHLYGAYGKRIYHQIDPLIERLRKDPSDRRAVLQIWDSSLGNGLGTYGDKGWQPSGWHADLETNSKDPPCNNLVYFKLRDNKLHMTVINRSNDLHFGLFAVNLPTFGILQSYIAARLGVDMGTQTHFSNSLHIYTDEPRAKAITERMLNDSEEMPAYPKHELAFETGLKLAHKDYAQMCSNALNGVQDQATSFIHFAREYLTQYRNHEWHPIDLPCSGMYFDWILAGELFISKVWK